MSVKNYEKKVRVYCDLDGVLADFDKACEKRQIKPKEAKHIAGFYKSLDVLPKAIEAISIIESMGYDVWILSKCPDNNTQAASEKMEWVTEHFHHLKNKVIITPDKGAVGTDKDYLIDDHPQWANANNFPGTIFEFTSIDKWDEIIIKLAKDNNLIVSTVFKGN